MDQAQYDHLSAYTFLREYPLALYIRLSKARREMGISDVYLEWGGGQTMPLPVAVNLQKPTMIYPGTWMEFAIPMQHLARSLQEQGHVLSADVWLVVQDMEGNRHRKRILINDIPIWSQGGDPTNAR